VLRLFSLYRIASAPAAIALLVASNLLPLAGVLFWGWNLWSILILYWIENGIVGLLNIPKMLLARGGGELVTSTIGAPAGRAVLTAFFCVHYGIFWLVHGIFVWVALPLFAGFGSIVNSAGSFPGGLPGFDTAGSLFGGGVGNTVASNGPRADVLLWGTLALLASHLSSFFLNYIGRREYLTRSIAVQMFAPYSRVVVLHLTILIGAFVAVIVGEPIGALVVLVVLKTALDLALHLREHDPQPRPTRIEEADRPH
jgi:uncharacterized protein DUF6498